MCLDSRGSDSYFILYVNKDGAATGAGQAPPAGEHNITLLLYTPTRLLFVAKIVFTKKYLRSVENICYCLLTVGWCEPRYLEIGCGYLNRLGMSQ